MNVNLCPVFVSSLDAHSDLWVPFFQLFKRAWPEYGGVIYLNTEEKGFSFPGLNIICTRIGCGHAFGEMFMAGMNRIPSEVFLLFMIDYFIESRVNIIALQRVYDDFSRFHPDSICLMPHNFSQTILQGCSGCHRICPPGGWAWFSFQAAFWSRRSIKKFVRPWENPWIAELFGCRRASIIVPDIWVVETQPISYHKAGVLHGGGKWHREALDRIDLSDVPINFSNRDWYDKGIDKAPEWTWNHKVFRSLWMFMVHRDWLLPYMRSEVSLLADWFSRTVIGLWRRVDRMFMCCSRSERIDSGRKPVVAICAILKNESRYIREWIEFHSQIGVDRFYLYDNGSDDCPYEILKEYVASGLVEYTFFPGEGCQHAAYKHCVIQNANKVDWIAFIDLDEFIIPKSENLKDNLLCVPSSVDQVLMSWLIYGEGYMSEDSDRPVTERFLWRGETPGRTKAFVRPKRIVRLRVHEHIVCGATMVADVKDLHINHYHCKTKTEYSCKMKKGDVARGEKFASKKYNQLCFDLHNLNQVYDPCATRITRRIAFGK